MKKVLWLLCVTVFIAGCFLVQAPTKKATATTNKKFIVENDIEVSTDDIVEVSFSAVGDNLIHGAIYYNSVQSDGSYRFDDIYENTDQYIKDADLAYINMETICAGKELGLSSFPKFNGPTEVIDAVVNAGYDWLSGASNHSMDKGEQGILKEISYIKEKYPQITLTGLHDSNEDAKKYKVLKIKGLKIGLLDYTYGLNGNDLPSGKEYLVDLIDKEKIKNDMEQLNQISDVQLVSMHWGVEYHFDLTDTQKELAQYLSNLGADVIIGTHPHVIQPVEYLTGKQGNKTLVMYSLGNFLSAQDKGDCMLGGLMQWSIQYNKTNKELSFQDIQFLPTVTQIENEYTYFRVYALKDWTDEMASRHTLKIHGENISKQYYIDLSKKIVGDQVKIVYE